MGRRLRTILTGVSLAGLIGGLVPVFAATPPRVLIVHSFGSAAPPFTTLATTFETALATQLGGPVDLDQVSLDLARFGQPEMRESFVEFLENRRRLWHPDLVVPIGGPASLFIAQNRDRLFPMTTVLYAGLDQRLLPAGAFGIPIWWCPSADRRPSSLLRTGTGFFP
jgi:hypothetical protein